MIPTAAGFAASPQTADAVARAQGIAILIGGYDGSGNYGDLAQLDAALALLARLEPGPLLLPVLERSRLADHRASAANFLHPPTHCLFFGPGEEHEDDLLPLPAPAGLAFAGCYLYGGGYLNPSWGERKLAMLRAAEALLCESATICRISSGLQVDPEWIDGLDEADARRLRSFELLGARDRRSAEALAALGSSGQVMETADDAVGALRRLQPRGATRETDNRLTLNLHIAEHPWVTERPEAIAGFHAGFAAELGRHAGLPVTARPLVAYADSHVSESGALERLAAACRAQGVELAEPHVLLPSSLAGTLADMSDAALTLSCSYHVALTSLLLGVPAVLLGDNAYYEQKAAGLAEAFGLPQSFAVNSRLAPQESAHEIARTAVDEHAAAALRYELALRASWMRERRAGAEAELIARLGGAAAAALSGSLGELATRLHERSAEPAELLNKLSLLQSENGALLPTETSSEPPEDGAAEEMLAEVIGSRSWRMTAPLRRFGGLLRRRG